MITETAFFPDPCALQRNRDLMREFERALEMNPAANLTALIPDSYLQNHLDAQPRSLETSTAKLNQKTVNELQDALKDDPEVDLLSIFPPNYARRRQLAGQTGEKITEPDRTEQPTPPDFRTRLGSVETAEIIFPLSNDVTVMLTPFSDSSDGHMYTDNSLVSVLQRMLWNSKKNVGKSDTGHRRSMQRRHSCQSYHDERRLHRVYGFAIPRRTGSRNSCS